MEYFQARKSHLFFYRDVPLYHKIEKDNYVRYKPSGINLGEMRVQEGKHPDILFIKESDKLKGIQEAQKAFNHQLEADIKRGNIEKVKETLVNVVEETLTEPRSGSIEGLSDTVDVLISDYAKKFDVLANLLRMSGKDYSTALHSINVMAFALSFAAYCGYSHSESRVLGLASLLHDVGKTQISQDILKAPRQLTCEEFEEMQSHTTIGYQILRDCRFPNEEISRCAHEHHEKLDGSGYPGQKIEISSYAQLVGILDCYEALTNDYRPYRSAMEAFEALNQIIGQDVKRGKFNKELYTQFVKSLGRILI
jgi:putative nucleotidyltransferase with HDIG domain